MTKDGIERYLGKKTRHANNYGMRGQAMSDSLARENFAYSKAQCDALLKKVNEYDPSISGVFHTYVREPVSYTHLDVYKRQTAFRDSQELLRSQQNARLRPQKPQKIQKK